MQETTKADLLVRLKGIEGHVRGVQKMIDEDRYCIDILKQTAAIKGAIERLDQAILANHMNTCVTTAVRSDNPADREQVIAELLDLFQGQANGKWGRAARTEQPSCH